MQPLRTNARRTAASLAGIVAVTCAGAAAFAYTAGWLSPDRVTPAKVVAAFTPPGVVALGHRRNHAKGICFTGEFETNGAGSAISRAGLFAPGRYPAVGRFNIGTGDPKAADATGRVRGMGLQISTPAGDIWRTAMIDSPVFLASTPAAFYQLLLAARSADPDAMKTYAAANPAFTGFAEWAKTAAWTSSYAEDRFNGLNSFVFVDGSGTRRAARWSLLPAAAAVPITPEELARRGPDYLEEEIAGRVRAAPQRWTMAVTLAGPGDPTADPTRAWPAANRTIEVGTLTVSGVQPDANGACRDINFDPTVLPDGIFTSDDPFPATRSAAYAKSYDLRTSEARYFPRTEAGAKP